MDKPLDTSGDSSLVHKVPEAPLKAAPAMLDPRQALLASHKVKPLRPRVGFPAYGKGGLKPFRKPPDGIKTMPFKADPLRKPHRPIPKG